MARVISLVNQKGGVGKTTTAVNLATYLASSGKPTLLVDLDPQGNASSGLGLDVQSLEKSLYHSLVLKVHPREVMVKSKSIELSLLPSNQDLSGAAVELSDIENREFQLRSLIKELRNDFDYIIIDSPPSLGLLTVNGLAASDEVLIPVQTEYFALEGLGQLLNTIDLVKNNLHPSLEINGIVLTLFDRRNKLARQVVNEVRNYFSGNVFNAVIPRTVRLAEAPSFGKSILDFDRFSKGGRAYRQLAKEIIAQEKEYKRK
ncbi:MAG: AAA family ATPase [Candidatus Moranbacteria bacterium]|nr:AAA family ATPase [Candidatus Moranbacteria bacterium]